MSLTGREVVRVRKLFKILSKSEKHRFLKDQLLDEKFVKDCTVRDAHRNFYWNELSVDQQIDVAIYHYVEGRPHSDTGTFDPKCENKLTPLTDLDLYREYSSSI